MTGKHGKATTLEFPDQKSTFKWLAGIAATVTATLLVTLFTNAIGDLRSLFSKNDPLAVSPVSMAASNLPQPSVNSTGSVMHREYSTQDNGDEFYFTGNLPSHSLPPVPNLMTDAARPSAGSEDVSFEVSGSTSTPTIITGMSVQAVGRISQRKVTAVYSCWHAECTDDRPDSIDSREQKTRYLKALITAPGKDYDVTTRGSSEFPFTVSSSDVEYFEIDVNASHCSCSWKISIDWTQGNRSGKDAVMDNGNLFRSINDLVVRQYCYDEGDPRGYASISDPKAVQRTCDSRFYHRGSNQAAPSYES